MVPLSMPESRVSALEPRLGEISGGPEIRKPPRPRPELKPSLTVYERHGKGPRQQLRFSKTGDPNLEAAYATHLIRLGQ